MKRAGHFKYYPVVLAYTAILVLFLFLIISVIISHHNEMMNELESSTRQELKLIGNFAQDALVRRDYASFEYFLNNWATEHQEIVLLRATAPNNFVLVDFQRSSVPARSFHITERVTHERKELIFLEMVKDMSPPQISMLTLRYRLIFGSVVVTGILGLVLWIAMRKLALAPLEREMAMKEQAENKFRMLIESAPDSIVYSDKDGKIVMVNGQTEKLFNYARTDLEGKNVEVLMPERLRKQHRNFRMSFLENPQPNPMGQNLELLCCTKEGKEFPADIMIQNIETEDGMFFLSSIRDIRNRKIAEEKIRRGYSFQTAISKILRISLKPVSLKDQLQLILDVILSIQDASFQSMGSIYLMDDDETTMSVAAQRGISPENIAGASGVPTNDSVCSKALDQNKIQYVDCTDGQNGSSGTCSYSSPHRHYCVPIVSGSKRLGLIDLIVQQDRADITEDEELLSAVANTIAGIIEHNQTNIEKQQLQKDLAQSEKMSALGRLAANVAHEIRNPLTLIGGFARRLSRSIYDGKKDKEYSKVIITQVTRLEKILKNVLTYSRQAPIVKGEHDMNEIIEEVITTYRNECTIRSVEIKSELREIPPVLVDKDQIWMVLNNMFANALDSMPDGGTFTIYTEKSSLNGKNYVVILISDTGTGISSDHINSIFEPFYTTKLVEQGTGLGLSISKKITEDHGGFIKVASDVETGTTFSLYFPLSNGLTDQ